MTPRRVLLYCVIEDNKTKRALYLRHVQRVIQMDVGNRVLVVDFR